MYCRYWFTFRFHKIGTYQFIKNWRHFQKIVVRKSLQHMDRCKNVWKTHFWGRYLCRAPLTGRKLLHNLPSSPKMNIFWRAVCRKLFIFRWRMVPTEVIFDQLEMSHTKKDLKNGFSRQFYVDPCGANFFWQLFFENVANFWKNFTVGVDIDPHLAACPFNIENWFTTTFCNVVR